MATEANWQFAAPAGFKKLVAYADLNCPFCYALERRVAARDVDVQIEWRLVEHAPGLPTEADTATDEEMGELTDELTALETRAPDVPICRPPFRPKSGPAIAAVAEASRIDPSLADELRRALYRALWVDGRNIADAQVIDELAQQVGLGRVAPTEAAHQEAAAWTRQWRASQLNRIPCLLSNVDSKLIGLTSVQRLDLFLQSGLFGSDGPDACETHDTDSEPA